MAISFSVTIEGMPPSVNHSYRPIKKLATDTSGRQVTRMGMAKNQKVTDYQQLVVWRTRASKPSTWQHDGGWILVSYRFFLTRRMDCDNAMKALNDAIAMALGVDDFWFLPCVASKTVNSKEPPRVEVTIRSELPSSPPTP